MPEESQKKNKRNKHESSRWHNFHFSGKVIIGSVFLGLGLILIGGLVYAIGEDNEVDPKPEKYNDDVPTKAPISIVGPVVMGIGGFIVVVGIIMCLFETEVCRKRSADSNPLISEEQAYAANRNSEAVTVPSTSLGHDKHRQKGHKKSPSPRRMKGNPKKSHSSKEKSHSKSSSPSSPPVLIQSPKNFLTASEDKFLTPPNSMAKESMALSSNSRDAENQTSSSLLKSFTSSGPSWTTSTEFQTPATSFKDTSSSLEASAQTDDFLSSTSTINSKKDEKLKNIEEGFLTPIVPSEDKIKQMRENIQRSNLYEFTPDTNSSAKEVYRHSINTETKKLVPNYRSPLDQSIDPNVHSSFQTPQMKLEKGIPLVKAEKDVNILTPNQSAVNSEVKHLNINHENKNIYSATKNSLEEKNISAGSASKTGIVPTENLLSSIGNQINYNSENADEQAVSQNVLNINSIIETTDENENNISSANKFSIDRNNFDSSVSKENISQKVNSNIAYVEENPGLNTESVSESQMIISENDSYICTASNENQPSDFVQKDKTCDSSLIKPIEPDSNAESLINTEVDTEHENYNVEKEKNCTTDSCVASEFVTVHALNESSKFQNKKDFEEVNTAKEEKEIEEHRADDTS